MWAVVDGLLCEVCVDMLVCVSARRCGWDVDVDVVVILDRCLLHVSGWEWVMC